MCVSCGHKCTQFPDKPSVPEDQNLEEVARGLYPAGTISFKLPTTTASTLPADSVSAAAGAGVAPMDIAATSTESGSVESNNTAPPSAAAYRTALRATPQYISAPNTTTAFAPTQNAPASYTTAPYGTTSHSTAPNVTAAYTPTKNALAPYTSAPYATVSHSTAPYCTYTPAPLNVAPYANTLFFSTPFSIAQPPTATPAPPTSIPEPQLQPTIILVPRNSLAVPFALMPRPPGILDNHTRTEGHAIPDPHASYMGQNNEEYRYPPPSREGYYMALVRRKRG
ncbi:hypothetical protein KC343_g9040 [Hortaea werneckii]|nr:hypothetical protein KC323_g1986 [Hortaea werneckii]KAI6874362.1 hypothetical protein KC338_g1281 [Hortaea werneckii]KAI7184299.1 hypothetical protein KC352_g22778 [Hortaea werneckii]KAI7561596.1 hypothetical protein KC317_g8972 [Hortaea werneckii]KAI7610797.1 hypothetical protein KC346_g8595 [Hortaea werneckii]